MKVLFLTSRYFTIFYSEPLRFPCLRCRLVWNPWPLPQQSGVLTIFHHILTLNDASSCYLHIFKFFEFLLDLHRPSIHWSFCQLLLMLCALSTDAECNAYMIVQTTKTTNCGELFLKILKGQCHKNFVLTDTVGVWTRSIWCDASTFNICTLSV